MTVMPFLVGRHYLLISFILLLFSLSTSCQTIQNPSIGLELITFKDATTDNRIVYLDNNKVAQSQAFQTVYLVDTTLYTATPLFDFHDACNRSTTLDDLQQWNGNGVNTIAGITARKKIALVKRGGNCTWTDKLRTVTQLSTTYQLQVDIMIIYDNQSYPTSIIPRYNSIPATGITTTPVYSSPQLPSQLNISNMNDNDILPYYQQNRTIIENQPSQIYFVTNDYGLDLLSILQNQCFNTSSYATNGGPASYLFLIPLLMNFDWSKTMNNGNSNYLSWIIACATFFLIAVLGLLLFFRWWRRRQRQEEREYNAMLEERNLIAMQRRKLKPLPVSIVNSYPIQEYNSDTIKNTTCAICLDEFEENQPDIRLLPCGHGFCVLCIDPWLTQKSTLCPICKFNCLPIELRETNEANEEADGTDRHQTVTGSTTTNNNTTNADHQNIHMNEGLCDESTMAMDSSTTISPQPPLAIVLSALTKKTDTTPPTSRLSPSSSSLNPSDSNNEKTTTSPHEPLSSSASSTTNESSSASESAPTPTHNVDRNNS